MLDHAGFRILTTSQTSSLSLEIEKQFIAGGCSHSNDDESDLNWHFDDGPFEPERCQPKHLQSVVDLPGYRKKVFRFSDGFIFEYWDGACTTIYRPKERSLETFVSELNFLKDPRCFNIALTEPYLFALEFFGNKFVHASGVEKNGVGVLFTGLPHSGKSTLAAEMVSKGYSFLSDDQIGIRRRDKNIEMFHSPEAVGFIDGQTKILKSLEPKIFRFGSKIKFKVGKWKIPKRELYDTRIAETAVPKVLVWLILSDSLSDSSLEPLNPSTLLTRLIEENMTLVDEVSFPGLSQAHFMLLSELVLSVRAFEFRYRFRDRHRLLDFLEEEQVHAG